MKIAIVGGGISGLPAAHLLQREHEITVYEAASYAGGHTNTIRVDTADATHAPQVSAVWSADPHALHSFPVRFLAGFFSNHGTLDFRERPRSSTVVGGAAR
jgi:predicted NAD/FAD-binding protein